MSKSSWLNLQTLILQAERSCIYLDVYQTMPCQPQLEDHLEKLIKILLLPQGWQAFGRRGGEGVYFYNNYVTILDVQLHWVASSDIIIVSVKKAYSAPRAIFVVADVVKQLNHACTSYTY